MTLAHPQSRRRRAILGARPPVLAPLALALAALSPPLQAQSAADDPEQITIVGSRVKGRTVFDSPVPIDRYTAREVEQAIVGSGELGAALQALSPSINQPRASVSGAVDSVRVVQLRGLAPDQVLVLVNGKRRHTNAVVDLEGIFQGTVPVDLNTIPASAIERIEILRDGAGAQYGSDAIAGVINIVLKGGGQGGGASLSYGANHTDFKPLGRTLTDGQTLQLAGDQGFTFANGGTLRVGAELQRKAGTNRAGLRDPDAAWWALEPQDLALDGSVRFKTGDPEVRAVNSFANATLPLAGGAEAYAFATLARRRSEGAAFFRYPSEDSNVPAIYPEGYRPETTGRLTDIGAVAGARLNAGDWALDTSLRLGRNDFDYGVDHSLNASLGAASPTRFHLADFRSEQWSANLDATRTLALPGLAKPLNLAVGAEWLREGYRTQPGDAASYAAGPVTGVTPGAQAGPGLSPQDAVDISRHVASVYVDAEADIARDWLLAAALRYADYSDAGSSTTGKLAARYALTPQWLLRGSVSTSFRAPALAQQGFRFSSLNFNSDGSGLQNRALLPASDALAQAFGAQDLKPEKSHHLSVGTAWRPTKETTLSVDAYRIRVADRITLSSNLESAAVSAYLASIGRSDIQSVAFLTNALDTTTRGVDVAASHELALAEGTLTLNAALNYNRTRLDAVRNSSAALAAIDPTLTLVGGEAQLRVTHGSPRSKLILGADWQGQRWGVTTRATRYGSVWAYSYDDRADTVDGTLAQKLGGTWVVDLELQFKPERGLTLALGANNLFDRYPSRTLAGSSYAGVLPYNFLDPTGTNGAYYYTRANWRW
ncbi:TonB-dependent receptor plug domain-containing protein [Rubrivivax gelatinosus]|uniref:Putative TonB-dependent receptor n=1 Tax=Rubrivivax gelatinosus (strain NBRC 100245 / IL144) TaxID=983917 RepID=I0HNF6_RUBGI|nr:TonB-dependent receptor [Rubrivivax gelatinosus]BAL94543.1 putative TonB-dependent receptor [Rubrivivax gelatinosus IL144]